MRVLPSLPAAIVTGVLLTPVLIVGWSAVDRRTHNQWLLLLWGDRGLPRPRVLFHRGPQVYGIRGLVLQSVGSAFAWSPDRQGWAYPNGFGRSVHYFVPKRYLDNPPYCGDGVLVSLCKRMFLGTTHLFHPPDPKYSICKTCECTYHELLRERGGDEQGLTRRCS